MRKVETEAKMLMEKYDEERNEEKIRFNIEPKNNKLKTSKRKNGPKCDTIQRNRRG